MIPRRRIALPLAGCFLLLSTLIASAQTQTTGGISGAVKDQNGALIVGAEVSATSDATGERRSATTDGDGRYSLALLQPGNYRVSVNAKGFLPASITAPVSITETTSIDVTLTVAGPGMADSFVMAELPLVRTGGPELGLVVDSRAVSELPLATRNFTQILGLSPGTSVYLPDNTVVGRNSQNVSVNGSRVTQNNFQINGIDANAGVTRSVSFANPAPETIQEFKIQTSLYDATFGRSGGGNIQIVTRSGTNDFHGVAYEYFGNDVLNANNPFLKAAGARRPVLKRNIFGATLGGPIQKGRAFFFGSYQGTRERNGASRLNSISSNVLIAPGLTGDRSAATLLTTFRPTLGNGQPATSIDPTALALLNARLPSGQFLIPTPQAGGRYSGSAISLFREDQFNANVDYQISPKNWLAIKFFFAHAPQTLALSGAANVPGLPVDSVNDNRLLSIQAIHIFNPDVTNEARFSYNFIRADSSTRQPLHDSDVGIRRSTAVGSPGLPLIQIALNAGGIQFGTGAVQDINSTLPSAAFADILSIARGPHSIRTGGELRYYEVNFAAPVLTRGVITFASFNSFLIGQQFAAVIANGITDRNLRANDYDLFIQDDWKLTKKLTLNLGLRYELDLPPYDTRGRIATFDPALYQPRPQFVVISGVATPVGPPIAGFVQAGNAIPEYDLAEVPNVGKRVLRSIDPNNFAPRVGFAYSPFRSKRLVWRGGYGIFYSRTSFTSVNNSLFSPPFYLAALKSSPPATFNDPFSSLVSQSRFPALVLGVPLSGLTFDRNMRTPYVQQYNLSGQFELFKDTLLEVAYVGTRGLNLLRQVAINQARLASPQHPIINDVTGEVTTTNTTGALGNAGLRAPYQGVATNSGQAGFVQDQTTAQSSYNSLQLSFTRRLARGLQIQASYTLSKSIDNASGQGGGAGTTGLINSGSTSETSGVIGDQLNNHSNRGVSDFDRPHRFVLSYLWELPTPELADHSAARRLIFSRWQVSSIITAMSGLPIDIIDSNAGSLYGMSGAGAGGRPNWAPGATRQTATSNIPAGYFFNPFAFARPIVPANQLIPSSTIGATAGATCGQPNVLCTDFGNVGRNALRGPRQFDVDLSVSKRIAIRDRQNIEFRADIFNFFNNVNFANPISNLSAVTSSGGSFNPNGQITPGRAGDFGRIIATSNNPRIVQFALKLSF
ncbi:MAG: TonB-dependent receptor domain-containing protein [Pyrinomonadaceae bacterium]